MKFSAIVATVGVAAGHFGHHGQHGHHKLHHGRHGEHSHHKNNEIRIGKVFDYINDYMKPAPPQCDRKVVIDVIQQKNFYFNLARTVYVEFLKGLYQNNIEHELSNQCFHPDTFHKLDSIRFVFDKIAKGDYFNISLVEAKDAVDEALDAFYGTVNDCKFHVPVQDLIGWCTENTDKCRHKVGLLDRLLDNSIDIAFELYDLYNVLMQDPRCLDYADTVNAYGKMAYDVTSVWSL